MIDPSSYNAAPPEESRGLTLYEAARRFKVPFASEAQPKRRRSEGRRVAISFSGVGQPQPSDAVAASRNLPAVPQLGLHLPCPIANQYHVIALDARGHGDSQWPPDADYSLDAHQRDLDGVADSLRLRNFVVVGHSMGGRNGYVFASRRPDLVRGLVIVDTGPGQVAAGSRRIRNFISLPDQLNSYEEFVARVMEYTGRPAWLVHGSLQHTIREMPDGRWTWKYDRAIRSPGLPTPELALRGSVAMPGSYPVPHPSSAWS